MTEWDMIDRMTERSAEETLIRAVENGDLDADRVPEYLGRSTLLDLLRSYGYKGNVRHLKAALDRWDIKCRAADRCPSTADLRAAVADGRVEVNRGGLTGVGNLRRIQPLSRRRIAAQRMMEQENTMLRQHQRRIDQEQREIAFRQDRVEQIQAVLDEITAEIGPDPLLAPIELDRPKTRHRPPDIHVLGDAPVPPVAEVFTFSMRLAPAEATPPTPASDIPGEGEDASKK